MDNIMPVVKCCICDKDITFEDRVEIGANDAIYYPEPIGRWHRDKPLYRYFCPTCFAKLDEFLMNLQICTAQAQNQPDFYNPTGYWKRYSNKTNTN